MSRELKLALTIFAAAIACYVAGLLVGIYAFDDTKTIDSRTVPTLATVTLAGNGMVYCPTDGSAPKVAPCLNPPPTVTTP